MKGSAARVRKWRDVFLDNCIHQIHFIWETGLLASLKDPIFGKDEIARERAGGFGDWKDGLLERLTQRAGYALWREMSEDAALAFQRKSAAGSQSIVILREALAALPEAKRPKLHLIGHSAGSIWLGHLLKRWNRKDGLPIETLQLFAPACTLKFYANHIRTSLGNDGVRRATHYYLDDERERNDTVASLYGKSLLYLVSRAYQDKHDIIPLMGMEKYWKTADQTGFASFNPKEHPQQTRNDSHGGFDNDIATMNHALALILNDKIEREFKPEDLEGY